MATQRITKAMRVEMMVSFLLHNEWMQVTEAHQKVLNTYWDELVRAAWANDKLYKMVMDAPSGLFTTKYSMLLPIKYRVPGMKGSIHTVSFEPTFYGLPPDSTYEDVAQRYVGDNGKVNLTHGHFTNMTKDLRPSSATHGPSTEKSCRLPSDFNTRYYLDPDCEAFKRMEKFAPALFKEIGGKCAEFDKKRMAMQEACDAFHNLITGVSTIKKLFEIYPEAEDYVELRATSTALTVTTANLKSDLDKLRRMGIPPSVAKVA